MEKKRQKEIGTLIAQERKRVQQIELFPDRVPIEKLGAIWNDERVQYNNEQLYKIREWLYSMCNLALSISEAQFENGNKIVELKPEKYETKESHFIHPGKHRRAS